MGGAKSTVAKHPEKCQIDARLRRGDASTRIAADYGLSRQAMDRYKAKLMAKPAGTVDGARGVVRGQLMQLFNETTELMKLAKEANAPRSFLLAASEARRLLNSIDKLIDKLDATPDAPASVTGDVDTQKLEQVILTALVPFPAARQAVASALIEHHDREVGGEE